MQTISLGMVAAGAVPPPDFQLVFARLAEFSQRDDVRWLRTFAITMFIGTQLLNVVWCWVTSKIVVRGEQATVGNAFKVWIASFLLPFVVAAALFFYGPYLFVHLIEMSLPGAWALVGSFFFLGLLLYVFIPMQVYEIGFLTALGFIVLTIVIAAVGSFPVEFAAEKFFRPRERLEAYRQTLFKTDEEREAFIKRLFGRDAPDEIDRLLDDLAQPIGNPKPLTEREAGIQTIQQKLEVRRRALPAGDPKALAAFQLRFDRYMHLLNQVKADRAAQIAVPKNP